MEKGERVVMGVNKYVVEKGEDGATFRTQRYNEKTKAALEKLRQATIETKEEWPASCGLMFPAIINAFRADCTRGEAQGIL